MTNEIHDLQEDHSKVMTERLSLMKEGRLNLPTPQILRNRIFRGDFELKLINYPHKDIIIIKTT